MSADYQKKLSPAVIEAITGAFRPDWEFWKDIPIMRLDTAIILSCDRDPDLPDVATRFVEIARRKEIARAHVVMGSFETFEPDRAIHGDCGDRLVVASEFRRWGESLPSPFTFPDQFPSAAPKATAKPLRSDTRTNWLRIIRALYERANIPEREAVATLAQLLQSMGFDGPQDDTIRTVLNEARALVPDGKPK